MLKTAVPNCLKSSSFRPPAAFARPAGRPRATGVACVVQLWILMVAWVSTAILAQSVEAPGASSAPQPVTVDLWLEIKDAQGRSVETVSSADLEVLEDGVRRPVETLGQRQGSSKRFVIWQDLRLASSRNLRQASSTLSDLARQMTESGRVEVVAHGDEPEVTLRGRDTLVLTEGLSRGALSLEGSNEILKIRQRTLRRLRPTPGQPAWTPTEIAEVVVGGVREELELVKARQQDLLVWAAAEPASETTVLLWIVDGFDLDPVSFYTQVLAEDALREVLRRASRMPTLDTSVDATASLLAAMGWTVFPLAFAPTQQDLEEVEYTSLQNEGPDGNVTSAPGVTIRPGEILRRRRAAAQAEGEEKQIEPTLLRPLQGLRRMAAATGGEVAVADSGLRQLAQDWQRRLHLTYRSSLATEAGVRPLEIRTPRSEWTLRYRRSVVRGTPQAIARLRLERLLAGYDDVGELDVAAVLQLDRAGESNRGELEARLNLREMQGIAGEKAPSSSRAPLAKASLRVSVATAQENGELTFRHQLFSPQDLQQREEWRYRVELELPPGADEVAVLVEDVESGVWGGRRASVVRGAQTDFGDLLPAPTVIEVERPATNEVLRGRQKFSTRVFDSNVKRVEFELDDRPVAEANRAPFTARLDLGREPRRQKLTVIAFGPDGSEMGRDSVILNAGTGGLGIQIVEPSDGQGIGAVDVLAEVEVPVERQLERVLFFWNNEAVATLYNPPFRQRIDIPADRPVGYVRVVAILDDGSLAEDVLFMNGPAVASERLEVNLVELFVVVTDRDGRPVRGLEQSEFEVREDGVLQDVTLFSDASDLPITLGMAIDSSASMFVKLPGVQKAATDFLRSTFREQDRAFIVDFDSEPRLARATTGDLDRIVNAIDGLEASGRTALWESLVFSLVQLQGISGRKALVVFSDGADEDDQFPFRSAMAVARKMQVPIYLILMKKKPKEATGLSLLVRSFTSRVDRLVEETGGRVFYAKEYDNLGAVYSDIEEELRSQYLLAFYPKEPSRGESWRSIEIDVAQKGLEARTLQGYWD